MQIEAGKYYKTRDGLKAFVAGTAKPPDTRFADVVRPAVGWIVCQVKPISWMLDGFYDHAERAHDWDIVAEWEESDDYRTPNQADVLKEVEVRDDDCCAWSSETLAAVIPAGIAYSRFITVVAVGGKPAHWRYARIKK